MKLPSALSLLLLASAAASPALAQTLRCGSSLIQPGATQGYVIEKCGAPSSKEVFTEPVMARRVDGSTYQAGTTSKDIWRYKRGSGQVPAVLTFEMGVLKKLEFEK
jgi:hypothetical protein